MAGMSEYRMRIDTYAPGLKPRVNTEDKKKIDDLYSDFQYRLGGIEPELSRLGVERLVIDIIRKGGPADDGEG